MQQFESDLRGRLDALVRVVDHLLFHGQPPSEEVAKILSAAMKPDAVPAQITPPPNDPTTDATVTAAANSTADTTATAATDPNAPPATTP